MLTEPDTPPFPDGSDMFPMTMNPPSKPWFAMVPTTTLASFMIDIPTVPNVSRAASGFSRSAAEASDHAGS
jgi:hypothetical protein